MDQRKCCIFIEEDKDPEVKLLEIGKVHDGKAASEEDYKAILKGLAAAGNRRGVPEGEAQQKSGI